MFATVAKNRPSGGPYKICYELHGSGPNKVLLVMGLSGSLRAWDTTVNQLLARGGYEVCIFDNRGIGDSDAPGPGYSVKDMAQDAYELLQHLGWTENVFLAGVSMGGMISQELTLLAPQGTFAAIVFISTHAGFTVPPLTAIWTFANMFLGGIKTPQQGYDIYCNLVFAQSWLNAEPVGATHKSNREMMHEALAATAAAKGMQSPTGRSGQMAAIRGHFVSAARLKKIGQLGVPVLVMTGTEDNLIRPKNSFHIAKQIGCPLEVFEGAGHGLAQERPHRFHELMCATFAKSRAFVHVPHKADEAKRVAEADVPISASSL
ncbi:hypothetical protein PhCBS80983_g05150 [Powellomyces hirtus]|uniref:AB hydrolase-1 domain-containing protein n=1 Tax=Powellomyces hirtus TaxID=109895 RepID=A0A507DWT3_9FUNG|nr:hypothetical protein PhCBS80983_g05150 [Powellomyces hirtus]